MKERVLVTRSADGGGFSIALAQADFKAVEVPLVELSLDVLAVLAAARGPTPTHLVVPSPAAADALALALPQTWRAVPATVVGLGTQRRMGLHERPVARAFESAADLFAHWHAEPGAHVVVLRGDAAAATWADGLRCDGVDVTDVIAYRNREPRGAADAVRRELPVAFTALMSGSAARRLADTVGEERALLGRVAAMGASTAGAARAAGLTVHAVASPPTATGLVHALVALRDGAGNP